MLIPDFTLKARSVPLLPTHTARKAFVRGSLSVPCRTACRACWAASIMAAEMISKGSTPFKEGLGDKEVTKRNGGCPLGLGNSSPYSAPALLQSKLASCLLWVNCCKMAVLGPCSASLASRQVSMMLLLFCSRWQPGNCMR
jgi:hypothetical protein